MIIKEYKIDSTTIKFHDDEVLENQRQNIERCILNIILKSEEKC